MAEDLIRYDILVQDALRGIVRKVLNEVSKTGLPGEHHLYVSFETRAPGVQISQRLLGEYPTEMTIVLQHQFWDLIVTETFFEVGLSFGGVAEKLHIPFSAVKGFFDPSVQFHLQFEPYNPSEDEADLAEGEVHTALQENDEAASVIEHIAETVGEGETAEPAARQDVEKGGAKPEAEPEAEPKASKETDADSPGGAEVVSLDAFRKKT